MLQADGSLLAVSINAVCAALADAGIPMKHMFGEAGAAAGSSWTTLLASLSLLCCACRRVCCRTASVSVALAADGGTQVIDPDAAEEQVGRMCS